MRFIFAAAIVLSSAWLWANETIPFDSDRWHISAKDSRIEEHLGRRSLFLIGGMAVENRPIYICRELSMPPGSDVVRFEDLELRF